MARRDLSGAVDFAHLERFTQGDGEVIDEVLAIFPQQAELWSRLLDPAGPAETWRDGAHAIKGAALGIGANALARACGEAESNADAGVGRRLADLERIRNALDAALSDIAAYVHARALASLRAPSR